MELHVTLLCFDVGLSSPCSLNISALIIKYQPSKSPQNITSQPLLCTSKLRRLFTWTSPRHFCSPPDSLPPESDWAPRAWLGLWTAGQPVSWALRCTNTSVITHMYEWHAAAGHVSCSECIQTGEYTHSTQRTHTEDMWRNSSTKRSLLNTTAGLNEVLGAAMHTPAEQTHTGL